MVIPGDRHREQTRAWRGICTVLCELRVSPQGRGDVSFLRSKFVYRRVGGICKRCCAIGRPLVFSTAVLSVVTQRSSPQTCGEERCVIMMRQNGCETGLGDHKEQCRKSSCADLTTFPVWKQSFALPAWQASKGEGQGGKGIEEGNEG